MDPSSTTDMEKEVVCDQGAEEVSIELIDFLKGLRLQKYATRIYEATGVIDPEEFKDVPSQDWLVLEGFMKLVELKRLKKAVGVLQPTSPSTGDGPNTPTPPPPPEKRQRNMPNAEDDKAQMPSEPSSIPIPRSAPNEVPLPPPPPQEVSASEARRREGNELYKLALQPGLGASIRVIRFSKAIKAYEAAFDAALDDKEAASAAKNIGVANWKAAEALAAPGAGGSGGGPPAAAAPPAPPPDWQHREQELGECLAFVDAALRSLGRAAALGAAAAAADLPAGWGAKTRALRAELRGAFLPRALAGVRAGPGGGGGAAAVLARAAAAPACPDALVVALHRRAGELEFNEGVKAAAAAPAAGGAAAEGEGARAQLLAAAAAEQHWRLAMAAHDRRRRRAALEEEGGEFEEGEEEFARFELEDLVETARIARATCESTQLRREADAMLARGLRAEEAINMDLVFLVSDMYKQAAVLTREHDLENEAVAVSRLARLNDRVLKSGVRAKRYAEQALAMAASLRPKDVSAEPWHRDAVEVMAKFRTEAQEAAEVERLLRELTPELTVIKEKVQGDKPGVHKIRTLLQHLYQHHPPKDKRKKLGSLKPEVLKKTLLRALEHYHPDKNMAQDKKWQVLCSEISKYLTELYARNYKGSSV